MIDTRSRALTGTAVVSVILVGCGGSSTGSVASSTNRPVTTPAHGALTKAKACGDLLAVINGGPTASVQLQDIRIHTFQAACPAEADANGFGASYGTTTPCSSIDQHGCTAWHDLMLPDNLAAATIEADARGG